MERIVVRASKIHPFLNASQIKNSQKIDLCTIYVRKTLLKYGLRAQTIVNKPSISWPNRKKKEKSGRKICWSK